VLLTLLAALVISAWRPLDLEDFLIEHLLTGLVFAVLLIGTRRWPLSDRAWLFIGLYSLLHILGAHYTYTQVPYDDWTRAIFGQSLNDSMGWERNHFDRLVHFLWGFLLFVPLDELVRRTGATARWAAFVTICILATASSIYEMLEWSATIVLSPEAAETYNGQQGDLFDAQKDTALALTGSILAMALARWRWG